MNNEITRQRGLTRLLLCITLTVAGCLTAWSQNVWTVCTGNTYQYAYCSVNPTSTCSTCVVQPYMGGDATGYVITRGANNGASSTTIQWLKAGTYMLYYSCEIPAYRTVTVIKAETQYPVTGGGVLCNGSRTIRLTNSENLMYGIRKNNITYGSENFGSPGMALEWTVTEAGTYEVYAKYGCTYANTSGQPASIGFATVTASPDIYTVSGGGTYCPGGSGLYVSLSNSKTDVTYELYKDDVLVTGVTSVRSGSGILTWGGLTAAGTYKVKVVVDCGTRWAMTGQAVITTASPTVFTVAGGGAYCTGGTGLPITLSGSQTGVNYQLILDNTTNSGAAQAGTGNALQWPGKTASGAYTVLAYNNSCSVSMNGSAAISIQPLLPGATMTSAISIGGNLSCGSYDNQKTIGGGNCFGADYGSGGDDIFYTFTTPYAVSLTASHCGSAFATQLYVLNSAGGVVTIKAIDVATSCQDQNKLQVALPAGTYYVVSKAASASSQGVLSTHINLTLSEVFYLTPASATILEEETAVLTAPAAMTTIYGWTPNDNTIEATTARNATVRPGVTTTYQVSGLVNGCAATAKAVVAVHPDNTNHNYVKNTTPLIPGIQSLSALDNLTIDQKSVETSYFDGLGRGSQQVSWQASPQKKDIVQPIVFDKTGRETLKYLPYVSNSSSGQFKVNPLGTTSVYSTATAYNTSAHHAFYTASNDGVANDERPYTQTRFDASPLNEVVKQGAPGAVWQPDADAASLTDKTIKKRYENNQMGEVLHFIYNTTTGALSLPGRKYYDAGQLAVTITLDEQAHEVREYSDKDGHVLLKKVEADASGTAKVYACTYYVYNDLGDLAIVVPPEAINKLTHCDTPQQ